MPSDVKPCPFCGSQNVEPGETGGLAEDRERGMLAPAILWLVWCRDCDAQGPVKHDEGAAIEAWNERGDHAE